MKVEFPVRWSDVKKISPEDEEAIRAINGGEVPEEETHHYDLITVDLKDVRSWNKLDIAHTIVRTYQKDSYCLGIAYEKFQALWTDLTGEAIIRVSIHIDETKPEKVKKPKKKKDSEDEDFLM